MVMEVARPVIARIATHLGLLIWLGVASTARAAVSPAEAGVRGYWQEPAGGVIEIASCTSGLCLTLVALPPGEHPRTDVHNPDEKLRGRALCGLRIGEDFTQTDSQHAERGRLYDPKSGRTYSGSMTAHGDTLKLRGYVGISLFGRTETWVRVGRGHGTCARA